MVRSIFSSGGGNLPSFRQAGPAIGTLDAAGLLS
jgi:hypothetical protein